MLPASMLVWLFACMEELPHREIEPNLACSCPPPELPSHLEDQVHQRPGQRVDLLLVVQDTPGMGERRERFAERLSVQLGRLTALDARIGVISADVSDPETAGALIEARGYRWIDADTPMADEVLREMMLRMGEDAPQSQPRAAVFEAIAGQAARANAGFLREDAALAVIVASDGEDQTDPELLGEEAFAGWLSSLGGQAPPSWSCLLAGEGSACASLSGRLGGAVVDEDDPAGALLLAARAADLLGRFPLSRRPEVQTLRVQILDSELGLAVEIEEALLEDGALEGDWLYHEPSNSISLLNFLPPPGMSVLVEYMPLDSQSTIP